MQSNTIVRSFVFASLLLTTVNTIYAQADPEARPTKQSTIKVQTTLVMVPAIVADRSGNHIDYLKEEDFVVLRDGKSRKIGFFRHVQTNTKLMKPAVAPSPDGFTNAVESNDQRLTIFVLDYLNSSF